VALHRSRFFWAVGLLLDTCRGNALLTQPPVKRVLIAVQGGYMPQEKVDLEKDEGVRIGDVLSFVRATKAVTVMSKRKGKKDFTTIELKFDEHYTGVKSIPMWQLVRDAYGNVNVRTI
jgi:hypothetical protein